MTPSATEVWHGIHCVATRHIYAHLGRQVKEVTGNLWKGSIKLDDFEMFAVSINLKC